MKERESAREGFGGHMKRDRERESLGEGLSCNQGLSVNSLSREQSSPKGYEKSDDICQTSAGSKSVARITGEHRLQID